MHYTKVIEENQLTAELMRIYNNDDLVMCDTNTLCANVNAKSERYGDHKQYVSVMSR